VKKALLVGLNHYDPQKPLRGCVNDAREMDALLKDVYAFDETTLLTDEAASRDLILAKLKTLLDPDPGEEFGVRVFFFAGHGGRVLDRSGDEIDGIDENLCMPNFVWTDPSTYILDDELSAALENAAAQVAGIRVYVILDACHSGTGTKSVSDSITWQEIDAVVESTWQVNSAIALNMDAQDERLNLLAVSRIANDPPELTVLLRDVRGVDSTAASSLGLSSTNQEPATHLLLSGCTANQTCKDVPIEGEYHGIFTYTLTRLVRANPNISWIELRARIEEVIAERFNQNPQLEGRSVLKGVPAFS
jgi:metacaspase-1